jgi:hypothetical protein
MGILATLQSSKANITDQVVAALKAIVFAKKMGHNKVELTKICFTSGASCIKKR